MLWEMGLLLMMIKELEKVKDDEFVEIKSIDKAIQGFYKYSKKTKRQALRVSNVCGKEDCCFVYKDTITSNTKCLFAVKKGPQTRSFRRCVGCKFWFNFALTDPSINGNNICPQCMAEFIGKIAQSEVNMALKACKHAKTLV